MKAITDPAALVREFIRVSAKSQGPAGATQFEELARRIFKFQFERNAAYQSFCRAQNISPENLAHWRQIPAMPAAAFKELELSCIPPAERTAVFHSSGTTGQRPSRHFHNAASLALYEDSLLAWFRAHLLTDFPAEAPPPALAILTPPPSQVPHSSLAYMFDAIRRQLGAPDHVFLGQVEGNGAWGLNFQRASARIRHAEKSSSPIIFLGAAFSFVHLLDEMAGQHARFALPPGSRALETGGYKGRSRVLSKPELHAMIASRLGIAPANIICEYGMSELSSQAYDCALGSKPESSPACNRVFRFPPWARAQLISPETGEQAGEGEKGLVKIFDLANVFSVLAIQTQDLAIRRGNAFELLGRSERAEPRGCSLMAA